MAKISGKDGAVSLGGTTIAITSWSLDITADVSDTTDSSNATWKEFEASGWSGWTANCEGYQIDGTADETPGDTAASLILTMSSGDTYTGDAIVTGISTNLDIVGEDFVKKSYTFQGTGTLTLATS